MDELSFSYNKEHTLGGVVRTSYSINGRVRDDVEIVSLTGFGTTPPPDGDRAKLDEDELRMTSYDGLFSPLSTTELETKVSTFYHPAVLGNGDPKGFYDEESGKRQLKEALKAAERPVYLVTHSMATLTAYDIMEDESLDEKVIGVCLLAPWTTAHDSLRDGYDEDKKYLGTVNLITAFNLAQHLPLPWKYPLSSQKCHDHKDGEDEKSKHWGAAAYARTDSAKFALTLNGYERSQEVTPRKQPLVGISLGDQLFPRRGQRIIGNNINAWQFEFDEGHRCLTSKRAKLLEFIRYMGDHIDYCLAV